MATPGAIYFDAKNFNGAGGLSMVGNNGQATPMASTNLSDALKTPPSSPTGRNTSGVSTAPAPNYSAQIAGIDSQMGRLNGALGSADTQLNHGLDNINTQYGQQQNAANTTHSRALQDLQTNEQNDNQGHMQAIDQVNTKARTLANSVRQMIGNASGSGSSAYQVTAPDAVQRQADLQSQDINNSFGQNITALHTTRDRNNEDYNTLLGSLNSAKNGAISSLRDGILGQKNQIQGQLADLAAQRAAYAGGGAAAVAAATHPYEASIATNQAAIDNLYNQYKTPFNGIQPLTYTAPTLRDYATGKTSVAAGQDGMQSNTVATYNPLATWNKQDDNSIYGF